MKKITYATATDLAKMLATGRISACELLDENLARVRQLNPQINAVVALDEEGARRSAKEADAARARGASLGPLHGVSMTIKDTFAVTGMTATCGLEPLRDYRPAIDAAAVAKLRAAGAIIFGKTNLPPAAADHQSCNSLFGLTRNPWNGDRTVGGSSGGSAAALGAGFTPLELGSDIGGSIRVPSHFCGVYGHKPSYGIVPLDGHIPPPPGHLSEPELAVVGPLARSAFDLELMLDLITDAPELKRTAYRLALPPARHTDLHDFRVAVWNDAKAYALDGAYAAAIDGLVEDLTRLGVKVDTTARPAIDPTESFRVYMQTLFGIIGVGVPPPARDEIIAGGKAAPEGSYPRMVAEAMGQSLAQFADAAEAREKLFRAWRVFFTHYDVLLCPITPTVAFPHDVALMDLAAQFERRIVVNGQPSPYMDNLMWPGLVTVANLPATAIPTRRLVEGLPAGVQIVGPYLEDRTPLKFAQLLERALGGFIPPPL
ncbi:amidase [Bradyrhizobium sp. SSUT112]|uniref:amidase n=1 Tax=Bradyrhizobium sp. SSUT112 TaxID=3040604 RepID=UPI00244AAB9C|nr:amidase [Bradyrhizobium sp. SSUT112]MDH2355185.1 amidase [Bradyrhizobium sp. SSUT112]